MSFSNNDDLKRALDVLTIWDVWRAAFAEGAVAEPPPQQSGRDASGLRSPFREDGRKGSFSVCHGGRGFKDFGGDGSQGNVWIFALRCWPTPDGQRQALAQRLIELSGVSPTPRAAPVKRSQESGDRSQEVDPAIAKAAKAIARRDRARAAEEKAYEDFEKSFLPRIETHPIAEPPAEVLARWKQGGDALAQDARLMRDVARERGWPADWVERLAHWDLMAYPLERWCDGGERWVKRQKAFPVHVPVLGKESGARSQESGEKATTERWGLRFVGYHQRWFMPGKNGEAPGKGWLYVPSLPKEGARSQFEQALTVFAGKQGVTAENRRGLVPALPFVMGDLGWARLIVVLEGQWDAITFFGACGWLDEASEGPRGVAVFGVRGAQGVEPFLAWWQPWLRQAKPVAWIIADNDAAGGGWLRAPAAQPGMPQPPSFGDRLGRLGCRTVFTSVLKQGDWGKDFNDYYRALAKAGKAPGPAEMRAWMKAVGVVDALGGEVI